MSRSVVLLSSGLDSTVNLYAAREQSEIVAVLTFDYGQRAAKREIANARAQCDHLGLRHEVVEVPFFARFTQTSLVDRGMNVPTGREVGIDDRAASERSAKAVWVPNRNGIMLNIAAGFAEGLKADWVIPGFNLEEAATFPDNTGEFLEALTDAFRFSTANGVQAKCFTTAMNKTEIVKLGLKLGVKFELVWPCYLDGETMCGECESCQRYKRARRAAGV